MTETLLVSQMKTSITQPKMNSRSQRLAVGQCLPSGDSADDRRQALSMTQVRRNHSTKKSSSWSMKLKEEESHKQKGWQMQRADP